MLEGAVGVLPLIYDKRPGTEAFIAKFKKIYDRNPGTEASYHYSTLNAVAEAMKLAGTVSDPKAIHAKLSEAYGKLPPERNPARITSVDERGGSNANIVVGVVKNGKVETVEAASLGQ
jgi:branched-chain amino acid transport system substrate-binding protein